MYRLMSDEENKNASSGPERLLKHFVFVIVFFEILIDQKSYAEVNDASPSIIGCSRNPLDQFFNSLKI